MLIIHQSTYVTTNLDKNIKESGYSKVGLVLGLRQAQMVNGDYHLLEII